jgi:hypothetical protein
MPGIDGISDQRGYTGDQVALTGKISTAPLMSLSLMIFHRLPEVAIVTATKIYGLTLRDVRMPGSSRVYLHKRLLFDQTEETEASNTGFTFCGFY